jgi:hypothetical protein
MNFGMNVAKPKSTLTKYKIYHQYILMKYFQMKITWRRIKTTLTDEGEGQEEEETLSP